MVKTFAEVEAVTTIKTAVVNARFNANLDKVEITFADKFTQLKREKDSGDEYVIEDNSMFMSVDYLARLLANSCSKFVKLYQEAKKVDYNFSGIDLAALITKAYVRFNRIKVCVGDEYIIGEEVKYRPSNGFITEFVRVKLDSDVDDIIDDIEDEIAEAKAKAEAKANDNE